MTDNKSDKLLGLWRGYGDRRLLGLRWLAVSLTAISQPLLSAPFNWWPWHWVAWMPFIWAVLAQNGRGRWWLACWGGTLANILIFYWTVNQMRIFGNIPMSFCILLTVLLALYLSVLWILFAIFIPKLHDRFPRAWVFLVPALLVTLEFALPQLFPYMQGVSHYQVIPIFQLSSITGTYGVSFLLMLSNCVLYRWWELYRSGQAAPRVQIAVLCGLVVAVLAYGFWRQHLYDKALPYARKLKVGLIQSNFEPFDHEKIGSNVMLKRYVDLSHIAAKKGAEWIVWSEGEFKWALSTSIAANLLKDVAKSVGRPILLGGHDAKYQDKRWLYYNSAIHVHPEQGLGQRYDKLILVPFGEYMPYEKQLNFIYRKISWYSRYSPGDKTQIQELDGIPYGFLICYEAIYPRRVRRSVNDGAKLLVNITYDAWFGRSTAPYQHLMLAATRSAEFGVPLVRLATTGSSTVVNALGKTDKLSPIFEEQVLIYELPLVQLPSLYAKIGDIFAWLCLIFSLLAIGFLWIKPKRVLRTE